MKAQKGGGRGIGAQPPWCHSSHPFSHAYFGQVLGGALGHMPVYFGYVGHFCRRLGFTGPAQVTTHSPRCTAKSPVGALGLRPRPMLRSRVCVSCGVRLHETSNVPLSPSSTSNLSKRGTNTPFPNSQVLVQGGYISTLLPTACNGTCPSVQVERELLSAGWQICSRARGVAAMHGTVPGIEDLMRCGDISPTSPSSNSRDPHRMWLLQCSMRWPSPTPRG